MPTSNITKNVSMPTKLRNKSVYPFNPNFNSDSGWYVASTSNYLSSNVIKTWTNTPGYVSIIKASYGRRGLPMQSFSYTERRETLGTVWSELQTALSNQGRRYQWTQEPLVVGPAEVAGLPDLRTRVDVKILNKVKDNDFMAPVALAEARKTANMVYTRATHLAKMILALRKGNVSKFLDLCHRDSGVSKVSRRKVVKDFNKRFGKNAVSTASNTWLEYSYGWVPFMSEVSSATNAVLDLVENENCRIGRTYARDSATKTASITSDISDWSMKRITTSDLSLRAVWHWKPNVGFWPGRFGLLNPLEVVWELVPFSFVADWFLPIGDFLSTLDVPFRVTHLKGTYGRRCKTDVIFTRLGKRSGLVIPSTSSYFGGGGSSGHLLQINRTPMTAIPKPDLTKFLFDPALGTKRMISGIALLQQQSSRLRR